ncbi:hypothetical protein T440DRAFT_367492, partial [Plenodomus tracheiphilus IPT5]
LDIKVDSDFISQITAAEKTLTNSNEPVKGGPTAKAQQHVGQELNASIVSDITAGEKVITNSDEPAKGGPTSVAQSALVGGNVEDMGSVQNTSNSSKILSDLSNNQASNQGSNNNNNNAQHTGNLDSATLSKITDAEKKLTGEDGAVQGGPTAQAQKHANEPITSQVLHDITEGEKKVTGGERVKGGPTSTAQSELGKSRS